MTAADPDADAVTHLARMFVHSAQASEVSSMIMERALFIAFIAAASTRLHTIYESPAERETHAMEIGATVERNLMKSLANMDTTP